MSATKISAIVAIDMMSRDEWPDSAISQLTILLLRAILKCFLLRLGCQFSNDSQETRPSSVLGKEICWWLLYWCVNSEGYLTHTVPYWLEDATSHENVPWSWLAGIGLQSPFEAVNASSFTESLCGSWVVTMRCKCKAYSQARIDSCPLQDKSKGHATHGYDYVAGTGSAFSKQSSFEAGK